MDEYDDWFSDLEDDDLLALAALYEDDFVRIYKAARDDR